MYKLYSHPISYQLFEPPQNINCSLPQLDEKIVETEITLIVPQTKPIMFDIYKCEESVVHVCLVFFIFTHLSRQRDNVVSRLLAISEKTKNRESVLERLDKDVKAANTMDLEYAAIGKVCNYSNEYSVVKEVAGVFDENSEIFSDVRELSFCKIGDKHCHVGSVIFFWEELFPKKLCEYARNFSAIFAGQYILIKKNSGSVCP